MSRLEMLLPRTTRSGRAIAAARHSQNLREIRVGIVRAFALIGALAFVLTFGASLLMAFSPAERSLVLVPSEARARMPSGWQLDEAPKLRLERLEQDR